MDPVLREQAPTLLGEHALIPIVFSVDRVLDLASLRVGDRKPNLIDVEIPGPYRKDYDAVSGNHPTCWPQRFDVSKWGLIAAFLGEQRVGGAVIARDSTGLEALIAGPEQALLWDIRVAPEARGQGIGSALFTAAEQWAQRRGCRQLTAETQDINPVACRFYASRGCHLARLVRNAYPDFPDEVQLIWAKSLPAAATRA
ncbi:MAG: GNAT family N-acetyltransferase [Gemmatimonadaceae bacterium]